MSEKPPFTIFMDEFHPSKEESLAIQRLHRFQRTCPGWSMCEKFDERYDTEVGGVQRMIVQTLDHPDDVHCNDMDSLILNQEVTFRKHPSLIHDCKTGDCYYLEEAEQKPELKAVVTRLKERMVEYEMFRNRSVLLSQ